MADATLADLKTIERLVEQMPADKLRELKQLPAVAAILNRKWLPNPGPQTDAFNCQADCLLYGGEPGGGKSALILGLAFTQHQRSFIMRREYGDLERLIEDALFINGTRDGYNGSPPPRLRTTDNRLIYFRAAHRVGDEQGTMGQGRDLLGIDEACQFAESQVRFLMGWVRTETKGQRTRTILATNPPLTAEGLWVIQMFAPWLDERYPNPALPGELRWVISDEDGKDEWVNGPDDVREVNGKTISPTSRTYIPASVKDNPYYADTDYERQLDAMSEPWRSLLMGGFKTQFRDADNQVIPTAWIRAAQARWREDGYKGWKMTAMGLDCAYGGPDAMVLAWRYGGWFAPLVSVQGEQTADESAMAGIVIRHRRDGAPIVVDLSGGHGAGVIARFKDNEIAYQSFKGAEASIATAQKSGMRFVNKRAESWWKFREELDPDQEGGSAIRLPPDQELLADLASPTFKVTSRGIQIEDKDEIKKRLGRSPDKGDAVVMALSEGHRAAIRREGAMSIGETEVRDDHPNFFHARRRPKVILGYANAKRR